MKELISVYKVFETLNSVMQKSYNKNISCGLPKEFERNRLKSSIENSRTIKKIISLDL